MAFPLLIPALVVALKALLIKLLVVVLAYVVYKVLMAFGATIIDWIMSQVMSNIDLSDTTVQLTGFAAWIADTMMLGNIITLFISFCLMRFIIGIVRK